MVWLPAQAPPRERTVVVLTGNQLQEGLGVERLGGGHGARAGDVLSGGDEEAGGEAVDVAASQSTAARPAGPSASARTRKRARRRTRSGGPSGRRSTNGFNRGSTGAANRTR